MYVCVLCMKSYLFFNKFYIIFSNYILSILPASFIFSTPPTTQSTLCSLPQKQTKTKQNQPPPPTRKHVNETHNIQIDKRPVKQIMPKQTKQKGHELEH